MDASPISAVAPASVNLTPEANPGGAAPAMRGADFANLLGHLMDPGARQDLAAAGLQALPISSHIEVITAAEPLPDAASLAAFARGQGLDENTVHALFGAAPVSSSPASGPGQMAQNLVMTGAVGLMQPGLAASAIEGQPLLNEKGDDVSTLVSAALALGGLRAVVIHPLEQAAAMLDEGVTPAAMLDEGVAPAATPTSEEVVLQQSLALATGAVAPALLGRGQVLGKPAGDGVKAALPVSVSLPGEVAQAGAKAAAAASIEGARVSQLSWQVQAVAAPTSALSAHELQAQAASATVSAVQSEALPEAMRLRLAPSEFITQRLAAMAGTGEQATWGSVAGQSVAVAGSLRLDLRGLGLPSGPSPVFEAIDTLAASLSEQAAPSGTPTLHEPGKSQSLTQTAGTTAPWNSTAALRAEQYEQLAQRLGEALGQRLQSQLERGDWKVQMRLDPAHLGRIDLELDMSAGGLDAVFRSDNQLTRDLISQGLPRLRESLSQSGTAVANVWVQGDSNRQSGGNPTPGRSPDQEDETVNGREAGSDEELALQAVARPRRGSSAWDVLA